VLPVWQADGAGPKTRIRIPSRHPAHAAEFSWITVRNPAEILQATSNLKYKLARDWGQRIPLVARKMRQCGCLKTTPPSDANRLTIAMLELGLFRNETGAPVFYEVVAQEKQKLNSRLAHL
jgi:hypothetical protein